MTYSSLIFLILGLINFCFSYFFALGFYRYHESQINLPDIVKVDCAIAGALTLMSYSVLIVGITGIICFLTITLAFSYKMANLIASLICPLKLVKMKKNWHDIPSKDYSHYEGEFDFESDVKNPRLAYE